MSKLNKLSLYFGLIRVGVKLTNAAMKWYESVTSEDSEGGDDITMDEYFDLVPIIQDAIKDGLGLAVEVKLTPKVED